MLAGTTFAQQTPALDPASIPGFVSVNVRQFGNEELWGYINGGADLYLEYGFEEIHVFDVKASNLDYKADLYCMKNAAAAFGIYSIARFRCHTSGTLTHHDCLTPYQYIAAKGKYYLSVSNPTGDAEGEQGMMAIAANLLARLPGEEAEVPGIFKAEFQDSDLRDLKLVTGRLGIQNGFVRWDALFGDLSSFEAWILAVKADGKPYYVAEIRFNDGADREKFMQQNGFAGLADSSEEVNGFRLFSRGLNRLLLTEGAAPATLLENLEKGLY
ncbi:hypothetical protein DSECCO2_383370 [anaerobic digester metagenome]